MATGAETLADLKAQLALVMARRKEVLSGLHVNQNHEDDSTDWHGYLRELREEARTLREEIARYEPYQIVSYGRS